MGTIYKATCPCGFEQHELMEGRGMAGPDTEYHIYCCDKCPQIYSRKVGEDFRPHTETRCPRSQCRAKTKRLSGNLKEHVYQYPRCNNQSLAFIETGLWD